MNRRGNYGVRSKVNSVAASKLACFLGIPGLTHLTDEDIDDLIDFLKYLADESYADGFNAGCDAMQSYNHDVAQLITAAPKTEH